MWEKQKDKKQEETVVAPPPATSAIVPETLEKKFEAGDPKQMLTLAEQRIAPTDEEAKKIHDGIYQPAQTQKLTAAEQERMAEQASKTNIANDIMVNMKLIMSDMTAMLLLIVLACGLAVGIAVILLQTYLLVGLLMLAIMSPVAAGVVRVAYLFFKPAQDEAGNRYSAYDRLKEAVKRATHIAH